MCNLNKFRNLFNGKFNESNSILIFGIISYLYLFNSLVNNNFYIVFLYFTTLVIGFFIINKKILIFNFGIIIYDFINKYFIIEGNKNFNNSMKSGKSEIKNNKNFNNVNNSSMKKGMDKDESNDLSDNFHDKTKKDKENEKERTSNYKM